MIHDIPLNTINISTINHLIENSVSESLMIEYKLRISLDSKDDKREFLADVSSFANANGGSILVGISEIGGLPTQLVGVESADPDSELLKINSLVRDGISPRISGFQSKAIEMEGGRYIFIIRISRSWNKPHAVTFQGGTRFYCRHSVGKQPLDVHQIKELCNEDAVLAKRLRDFRADRLSQIISGDTPIDVVSGPKTVLHIVPYNHSQSIPLPFLRPWDMDLKPLYSMGYSHLINADGIAVFSQGRPELPFGYTQIYRNGVIESVDATLLSAPQKTIPPSEYEQSILNALCNFFGVQKKLGVQFPALIALSILQVRGFSMGLYSALPRDPEKIKKNDLLLPEVEVENLDQAPEKIMKPVFDVMWNACGFDRSRNYNLKGDWVGKVSGI